MVSFLQRMLEREQMLKQEEKAELEHKEKQPINRQERRSNRWKHAVQMIEEVENSIPEKKVKKQKKWWEMEIPDGTDIAYLNLSHPIYSHVARVQAHTKGEARALFKKQFGRLSTGTKIRQVQHVTSTMKRLEGAM